MSAKDPISELRNTAAAAARDLSAIRDRAAALRDRFAVPDTIPIKLPVCSISPIAVTTVLAGIDWKRVRQVDAAMDKISALGKRDPEVSRVILNMPADDGLVVARVLPAPARRPKGPTREIEDQFRLMCELLASDKTMTLRAAAALAARGQGTMTGDRNRIDYLEKLWRERRAEKSRGT